MWMKTNREMVYMISSKNMNNATAMYAEQFIPGVKTTKRR